MKFNKSKNDAERDCKCNDKAPARTPGSWAQQPFSRAGSLLPPPWARVRPATWKREDPAQSPEPRDSATAGLLLQEPGDGTCRSGSRALTARAPGCGRAAEAAWTQGRPTAGAGRPAGRGVVRGPGPSSPRRTARSNCLGPGRPPSHRPRREGRSPVLQRLTRRPRLPGAGSRERSASRPPPRGGSGHALPASRRRRSLPGATPPAGLARGASRRAGSARAGGRGLRRADWRHVQSCLASA